MAGVPLSAKNAKARVNGQVMYAQKWSVKPKTTPLDTTNFEDGGFEDEIAGLSGCAIDFEGWWDSAGNPFDAPLDVQDGNVISVQLYVADVGSPSWLFNEALVTDVEQVADVKDRLTLRFTARAKGEFFYPDGNV